MLGNLLLPAMGSCFPPTLRCAGLSLKGMLLEPRWGGPGVLRIYTDIACLRPALGQWVSHALGPSIGFWP